MSTLITLIRALPEILALLKAIQAGIDKMDADRKVADDIKTIHEALNAENSSKLDALFSNSPATSSVPSPTDQH